MGGIIQMNENSIAYCGLVCSFAVLTGNAAANQKIIAEKDYLHRDVISIIAAHQKV